MAHVIPIHFMEAQSSKCNPIVLVNALFRTCGRHGAVFQSHYVGGLDFRTKLTDKDKRTDIDDKCQVMCGDCNIDCSMAICMPSVRKPHARRYESADQRKTHPDWSLNPRISVDLVQVEQLTWVLYSKISNCWPAADVFSHFLAPRLSG